MNERIYLNDLKSEIEVKRQELNELVIGSIDRNKVLRFSMELDKLIYQYCHLERQNKKRAEC
ncbi:aspartyl-phosphate phosphatase Spo0E family protein [Anaerosalibacter massiliensis]|uniref:Aspartyl-phosphate phosphatase Spo0E family protein n=1 Tax=Anaerosalibacter massiliensis TaxID=1347392 RepID=A0A9X2MGM1_9FIRM|nr:aspartyl-phosphate phosphatase Spo0E family protein [Anaerosalibacter massiliensis]MCR2043264.1 aspartyl-phosphate phosphatase Spo0E family protein [Anaerosalibacter massiliensis]